MNRTVRFHNIIQTQRLPFLLSLQDPLFMGSLGQGQLLPGGGGGGGAIKFLIVLGGIVIS